MSEPATARITHRAPILRWWSWTRSVAERIPEQVIVRFRFGRRSSEHTIVLACALRSDAAFATVEVSAPPLASVLLRALPFVLNVGLRAWLRAFRGGGRAEIAGRVRLAAGLGLERTLGRQLRLRIVGTAAVLTSDESLRSPSGGTAGAESPGPPAYPLRARARSRRSVVSPTIPVLLYHAVADSGPPESARWRVPIGAFERQLSGLATRGYRSLSVAELVQYVYHGQLPEGRGVVLSFDDAYRDFHRDAWPLLQRHGFGALLFVVAGRVGKTSDWDRSIGNDRPLMSWPEIAEVAREGAEIGSHTVDHHSLLEQPPAAIIEQLAGSRQLLQRHTARDAVVIAYPYGAVDALVYHCARQAGYAIGFGTNPGHVSLTSHPYHLPRITVEPDWTAADVANRLTAPTD